MVVGGGRVRIRVEREAIWAGQVPRIRVRGLVSCWSRTESGHSQEVVGSGDQIGMHLHPLATAIARAPQPADGLHPAEGFFDPFADPLADRVTRMAYGAGVVMRVRSTLPANRGAHLLGIAMKAGYLQAIETTDQSVRIGF